MLERLLDRPDRDLTPLVLLYIAGWYLFSMSISIYNKWMFGRGLSFRFPLFVTAFHQVCLFMLSSAVLYFRPKMRPAANASPRFAASLAMPIAMYAAQILPCAAASAGDIGLSNVSLEYISLSLYTMLKTSSLIFVLVFGLLFRLERFSWRLVVIVMVMCASVMMMTRRPELAANAPDDDYQPIGIVLILAASVVLGLRWSFTQLLLKKNDFTKHPILTIFYILPAITVVLFAFALVFEGWAEFTTLPIWDVKGTWGTLLLMVIPGLLAFLMTLCEFQLLLVAQVLTLSIAGIFKELLTIMLGLVIFGDTLSVLNCIGLVITFLDILCYNYFRYVETSAPSYTAVPDLESAPAGESIELKRH